VDISSSLYEDVHYISVSLQRLMSAPFCISS
jgi:hypothetical protein